MRSLAAGLKPVVDEAAARVRPQVRDVGAECGRDREAQVVSRIDEAGLDPLNRRLGAAHARREASPIHPELHPADADTFTTLLDPRTDQASNLGAIENVCVGEAHDGERSTFERLVTQSCVQLRET